MEIGGLPTSSLFGSVSTILDFVDGDWEWRWWDACKH